MVVSIYPSSCHVNIKMQFQYNAQMRLLYHVKDASFKPLFSLPARFLRKRSRILRKTIAKTGVFMLTYVLVHANI